ncbi:MAG: hypothetical protein IGR76_04020 [Synechococcales cyanobacterium T60_A2020_003]|nr:hypothetical protein [Synechococcales cyanobacterium T60_A2020_003]
MTTQQRSTDMGKDQQNFRGIWAGLRSERGRLLALMVAWVVPFLIVVTPLAPTSIGIWANFGR